MQTNTQQLIILLLGIALFLLILMRYDTEIIIAIVSGLIGFLTSKTLTEKQEEVFFENNTSGAEDTLEEKT